MPRVSIGSWAFGVYAERPLPFGEVLDRVSALGFDGLEYAAFAPHPDADEARRDGFTSLFAERRLAVSGVVADFGPEGFLTVAEPAAYLAALDRNLELCRALGSELLIVNTVDPPEMPYEVGVELARERLLATWREAARRAFAGGVTLAWEFEPCWAFNEPRQIIELAHQLAGPGFGLLYDTAHAHTVAAVGARQVEGGPLPGGQLELLRELEGTIVHVHLLDSDGTIHESEDTTERTTVHVPFGIGNVDFEALAEKLPETEWWTVDLCFWPDAWEATEASKAFVDGLITRTVRG
jgi:sugar phosphate isomerase/epimerase